MMVEGAVGLPVVELDTRLPLRSPKADMENSDIATPKDFWNEVDIEGAKNEEVDSNQSPSPNQLHQSKYHSELVDMGNQRNLAALKLQKVYKSFRTRRQLADCAVVVEQRWWKVLDFAELKRSSISFFDIEKPESVQSRWSRARTRAAKVGKGLSKDQKARKLALQHWLEAIDPRHRYGHNLQFYYVAWLHCESYQPFFYWLDIGEGKELSLEICPRSKLHQQCIKYLGPTERQEYEVVVEDGQLIYKISRRLLDTSRGPKGTKWIFVLSTSKKLYVGMKMKGTFQHSSFLAGGATLSAGRLVVEDGILKSVWPHSGHYLPTEENFQEFVSFLNELNVDLTNVKKSPCEDEDEAISKKSSSLRNHFSEAKILQDIEITEAETLLHENTPLVTESVKESENPTPQATPRETSTPRLSLGLESRLASLEIPTRVGGDVIDIDKSDIPRSTRSHHSESPFEEGYETAGESSPIEDGYETAEETFLSEEDFMVAKKNLFDEDDEEEEEEKPIPKEKIMQRIDSHKGTRSYQLGQQLCSRWSTGAGPRIGCMRDYPSELRSRVLEQASLSPRAKGGSPRSRSPFGSPSSKSPFSSPKVTTPSCLGRVVGRSPLAPSPLGQSK